VRRAVSEVRRGGGDTVGLDYRSFERVLRGIAQRIENLDEHFEAPNLGARASDYTWFRRNFPRVDAQMRAGGRAELYAIGLTEEISRDVYIRGLDFVTTTVLHWQQFPMPVEASEPD
jgi:hypothetical protein